MTQSPLGNNPQQEPNRGDAAGQPAPAGNQFNAANISTGGWIVVGCGLLLAIFSTFGWVSVGNPFGTSGFSVGSWHRFWWLATLLGVGSGVGLMLRAGLPQFNQLKPVFLVGGAGAGFLITVMSLIDIFSGSVYGMGFSIGPGIGIWASLIISAVQTYFMWLWAQNRPGWTLPRLPGPANY